MIPRQPLHFERVPEDEDFVYLRAELINSESGRILGAVQVPLRVTEAV